MRFHDDSDPWQSWQQRLERDRARDLSAEIFPVALPLLDPTGITFGQWPAPRTIHFPRETEVTE